MNIDIKTKLNEIITNTNNDSIIWNRLSSTSYSFERELPSDITRKLMPSGCIVFSISKNEGNFLMTGHDIRFSFSMCDKEHSETIFELETDKNSDEDEKQLLSNMFDAIEQQRLRKITTILSATI